MLVPDITLFGWFHTIVGILALVSGFYTLAKFKVIRLEQVTGKSYLVLTLVAAASALGIYKHGGFGVAHALAVLTILAVLVGAIAEKTKLFGKLSRYIQAASYSATLLFHMIPAITDFLLRLPVGAPFVTELEDPLMRGFHLAFLVAYVLGFGLQVAWLRKNPEPQ
jgi:uncharacterized membrane protein